MATHSELSTEATESTGESFIRLFGESTGPKDRTVGEQVLEGFSEVIGRIIEEKIAAAVDGKLLEQKIESKVDDAVLALEIPDNNKVEEIALKQVEDHTPDHECSYDDWCEHARSWEAVDRDEAYEIACDRVNEDAITDLDNTDVDERIQSEIDDRIPSDIREQLENLDKFNAAFQKFLEDVNGGRKKE